MQTANEWLIWSNRHKMWWASDKKGYARLIKNAGIYSFEDTLKIVNHISNKVSGNGEYVEEPEITIIPLKSTLNHDTTK